MIYLHTATKHFKVIMPYGEDDEDEGEIQWGGDSAGGG